MTPLDPPPPPPARPGPTSAASRRSPRWLWPAIGLFVVALLVVAVVVSNSSGGSSSNAGSPSATAAGAAGGSSPAAPSPSGGTGSSGPAKLKQSQPVTVTGAPLSSLPDGGTDAAIGTVAPELQGSSFDGTAVSITHDGKPKLLLFAAHWCPHCQREVPLVVDHLKSHPLPSEVELYLVATGTNSAAPNYPPSAWLTKVGWPAPVLADDAAFTAADAFGLTAYPYFVALDAQGKLVARTSGELSVADFDQLVNKAVAAG
ncbi:MAG: Redoxin [Acidimicrobiia bacterium]|nr:Redoxin [Acidimicrobiia bacterium]